MKIRSLNKTKSRLFILDKLEIDLSEYELAAIEIPDRRRTGSTIALIGQNQQGSENRLQVPGTSSGRKQHHNSHHVRIVEPEPCKFKVKICILNELFLLL